MTDREPSLEDRIDDAFIHAIAWALPRASLLIAILLVWVAHGLLVDGYYVPGLIVGLLSGTSTIAAAVFLGRC